MKCKERDIRFVAKEAKGGKLDSEMLIPRLRGLLKTIKGLEHTNT